MPVHSSPRCEALSGCWMSVVNWADRNATNSGNRSLSIGFRPHEDVHGAEGSPHLFAPGLLERNLKRRSRCRYMKRPSQLPWTGRQPGFDLVFPTKLGLVIQHIKCISMYSHCDEIIHRDILKHNSELIMTSMFLLTKLNYFAVKFSIKWGVYLLNCKKTCCIIYRKWMTSRLNILAISPSPTPHSQCKFSTLFSSKDIFAIEL